MRFHMSHQSWSWGRQCRRYDASYWNCHLGSISPTFYEQLLRSQIPKAQKSCLFWLSFFALFGSTSAKAARRTLVKLTLGFLISWMAKTVGHPCSPLSSSARWSGPWLWRSTWPGRTDERSTRNTKWMKLMKVNENEWNEWSEWKWMKLMKVNEVNESEWKWIWVDSN